VAGIALEGLAKTYPGGQAAVRDVDLRIEHGELLVLVGPSGCGKSTLLRLLAGLETPTHGRILLDGRDVTGLPPQDRDLAMVFQSYALSPHMTVAGNLANSLRVRKLDRAAIEARVAAAAEALGLGPLLERYPGQLSGGQRQRVALGRALVREPAAFLLDEPLSNLDPGLRSAARTELLRLQRRLHATMVYVTHDQEEAMTLGSRVAVMRGGQLEQVAPPLDLYARPANVFVAGFMGTPPMNLLPAGRAGVQAPEGAVAGVRPHDVLIGDGGLDATVDVVEPRGHDSLVHLRLDGPGSGVVIAAIGGTPPAPGTRVRLGWRADRVHLFGRDGGRLT
jgi:ABC-type sugar transport system ATPase subunit